MSLLSTLRPLPQRLLERLWLILSGYVPISIEYHMTMNALNDDCLLILLDTLTMSQLLQLRGVSRRLCQLIEGHSLRKFKSLIFNCAKKKELTGEGTIEEYFAIRKDTKRDFTRRTLFFWHVGKYHFPASKLVSLRTRAWPLSLPHLLPRLSSLTLTHFLVDQVESLTEEQLAVNRLFVPYLNSNWSTTLTTLHLYIQIPSKPQLDSAFFAQLNQLTILKHLFIDFLKSPWEGRYFLFPDSMPILGQLISFSLHNYENPNTATLLHQLGPDLSCLSLRSVNGWEDDYVAFLRARPNYARTLKTLNVSLYSSSWKLFSMATQNLSSLVEFVFTDHLRPGTELHTIFTQLSHLKHLKHIGQLPLSIAQLRDLLRRQNDPGTIRPLTSITVAGLAIHNFERNGDPFQAEELFDQLLPLLSRIFCCLVNLRGSFFQGHGHRRDEALSEQFSAKMLQFFPTVKSAKANYYV